MRCPLCGGPVHEEEEGWVCELGHNVETDALAHSTELRLAQALRSAIEALESEAEMLRAIDKGEWTGFADEAETQARMLRELARKHSRHIDA